MRLSLGGKVLKILSYAFLILGAIIILFPFYVTIITAMKTQQQSAESFFSFPTSFYLENCKAVKYLGSLHLNNQFGLIIMCVTMSSSQSVFLLTNYIRSVPADLEEAAAIDGCSTFGAYWRVVVPLIKPMTMTIVVLNILWVWNDFQMPLIILNQNSGTWTLPLFQYNFKSQYTYDYNMAFASYLIAMVPVMIAYICAQKYIVAGLTQGAVKS